MTTMRELITRAFRKSRARPVGDDPDAAEMAAGLEDAQGYFLTLTGKTLTDVLTAVDYTAKEDERVFNTSGSPIAVTLPTTITEYGVTRAPRAGALVEVADSTTERFIYVPELASWKKVTDLTLEGDHPFGASLDDALSSMLAASFCTTIFQIDPAPVVVEMAMAGRATYDARFSRTIKAVVDRGIRPYWRNLTTEWI